MRNVYINKRTGWKFVNFIFTPENSNMVLCYLPFSHPSIAFSLFPCLSSPWICPGSLSQSGHVLGVSSLPLFCSQGSVCTAEYSFHLWSHNPGVHCLSEIHLLGVCQVCSPSVPKRAERNYLHLQKFLLNRLHVCCGCWGRVCAGPCVFRHCPDISSASEASALP